MIQARNDESLAHWLLSQPGVNASSLGNGNDFGPKQGTPGYPASLAIPLQCYGTSLKWFVYLKSVKQPFNSLFEMIEQDETP
jgi:hypothetical protein